MKKLLQKLLKKSHRRPTTDDPQRRLQNIPQGQLGSYQENLQRLKKTFKNCQDIKQRELPAGAATASPLYLFYVEALINTEMLEEALSTINGLLDRPPHLRPNQVSGAMEYAPVKSLDDAVLKVLDGWCLILVEKTGETIAMNTYAPETRSIERSESESVILGPQEAFIESIRTNLGILRRRLKSPDLKVTMLRTGKFSQKYVAVVHVEGIAQQEYVDTIHQRLQAVDHDFVMDSGFLAQILEDNPLSPFPQFHITERPERVTSHLMDGKVAVFVDGSPFVMTSPATFIEFFQTSEDYNNRWLSASVIRTLRLVGVLISISLSALYVAVVTYHYQMIPSKMLFTLTQSRARVPFLPIYETLLMEVTIELLREAGARLPTKVGQTIGIVGGIVIGQAAVTAGLTSNILIIAVALSTIASFITPSYVMSSTLRALRFFLIIFAGLWGIYGISIGLLLLTIHFLRMSSMGVPYLTPFTPLRLSDWKDTFIRVPLPFMIFRPTSDRPRETQTQPFKQQTTQVAKSTTAAVDAGGDSEGGKTP